MKKRAPKEVTRTIHTELEPIKTVNVAIADDHEISLTGLSEIISEMDGFKVNIVAGNGKELYDKIVVAKEIPDIVTLDISMPVWDGYQTIEAIHAKWPEIKILIITMHNHEMGIIKMLRSGASGYLMKNSKPHEIKKAILSIHERGHYFNETASSSMFNKLKVSDNKSSLTEKELQLLRYCASGMTYKQIAGHMKTNERNVHVYRVSLFEKFKVNTREELILCALRMGMLYME
jgi:two-component system, NarL family, invasion response regulator UvrY